MREIVARTSPPVSANRLATSRSVSPETPSRAATTSFEPGSPAEVSSASSTRARMIDDAGCTPVVVHRINSSRSRADSLTGRFKCDTTTPVLVRQGKGTCRTTASQPQAPQLSSDTLLVGALGPCLEGLDMTLAVLADERPILQDVAAPREFRFSDPNPLTSTTFARSVFRDLPAFVGAVVEERLGLCAGEWDVLVEDGEVYDFVGPDEVFWVGRTTSGWWSRQFRPSGGEVVTVSDLGDVEAWV
ncbi:hypothetical protein J2S66_005613 [Saccharothrix longispora]|uniref:Uncharacterized protein n=1 Tax=Saccharothrix longispora TaxID=33920 RepID=A0ABU1Q2Z1_9PSEU|nr:hypothetical protein [Saccharothrix longispora]MDR6597229.1 hypothetical protein [Saccharothrix longispora]